MFLTTARSSPFASRTWMRVRRRGGGIFEHPALVRDNGVAALQNPQRAELAQFGGGALPCARGGRARRIADAFGRRPRGRPPCRGGRPPGAGACRTGAGASSSAPAPRPGRGAARMRSRMRYPSSSMRCCAAAHAAAQRARGAVDTLLAQAALQHGQAVAQRLDALARAAATRSSTSCARGDRQFGGGRRRGRAQVGHEIGDGDVGFVAHGRNHRHGAGGDGARHGFFVEGPEVFERAAAARPRSPGPPTACG